ncbi:MAG: hypothetical protein DMF81_23930 [Acidobacteria bacterium]|nr:MAG: hypothetical protein DMF81_23930 [Acidobacteriota bacterium]
MATHDSGIVFSLALSTFAAWRGAALSLRRLLASGAGGERSGFSAGPLFEDPERHRSLEVPAALATGAGTRTAAADDHSLAPGGGAFGGGGASGDY